MHVYYIQVYNGSHCQTEYNDKMKSSKSRNYVSVFAMFISFIKLHPSKLKGPK